MGLALHYAASQPKTWLSTARRLGIPTANIKLGAYSNQARKPIAWDICTIQDRISPFVVMASIHETQIVLFLDHCICILYWIAIPGEPRGARKTRRLTAISISLTILSWR